MRKLFLIPLLALFVSVNMWGATVQVGTLNDLKTAVANAADDDVIQLTANNITLTAALTIDKNITLDLNGNTFKTGNLQKYLKCTGNVTITNGSYYMGGSTGLTTDGALTLNDVTFTNGSASKYPVQLSKSGASVTITNTNFGSKKADVQVGSTVSGTVTITSNKAYDNFAIEGTSISTVNLVCNANMTLGANTKLFKATKSGSGTLTLTGGIYGNDATRTAWTNLNATVAEGYAAYNTQNAKIPVKQVVAEEAVPTNIDEAEVGGLQMAFADALQVVATNGTIDILKDIEWTSFITVLKSCTIQGKNGVKNINIANPKADRDVLNCPIKFNANNINLTLKDLKFTNNSQYGLITNVNGTSKGKTGLAVTLDNVTFANDVEVTAYTSEPMTITDASNSHKVGYYTAYTDFAITTTNADDWNTFFGREKNILVEGYVAQNVYNDENYATIKNKFPTADDQIYLMKKSGVAYYRGSIIQTFDFADNVQIKDGDNIYRYKSVAAALVESTEAAPAQLLKDYSGDLSHGYLDLNGYKLTYINPSQADNRFSNKKITFSNSRPNETGTGIYAREGTEAVFIVVSSTNTQTTAKTCQLELTIKQGVKLICGEGVLYGIEFPKVESATKAYGLVVNFDGEIINNNPNCGGIGINGNITNSAYYNNNPTTYPYSIPQINIGEHANISIANGSPIYAAGYAIWNVNGGTLTGKSGVQIKSGKLNINGGTIHATGEGSRVPAYNSGMIESGAAVQIESNASYAGNMEINIANGATLTADGWYAIHEYVANSNDPTAVDSIKVTGGNFTGGILISQDLAAKGGFVSGGKWTKDVTAHCATGYGTTLVDGKYSVGEITTQTDIAAADKDDVVEVKDDATIAPAGEQETVTVETKKVTVEEGNTLTVSDGATLSVGVGAVHLDTTASAPALVVEAGGALVVEGLVYGATEDNFVIETNEDKPGVVLFSPETEFIKEDHPTATYKFKSYGYKRNDGSYVYQRFGIPTFDGKTTMTWDTVGIKTALYRYDYDIDNWTVVSKGTDALRTFVINGNPFECYYMTSDNSEAFEYTFKGALTGNANAPLNFVKGWNYYANSYTAPINIESLMNRIDTAFSGNVSASVYVYQRNTDLTTSWIQVNAGDFDPEFGEPEATEILPMQAFILQLRSGSETSESINYNDNVYQPFLDNASGAPARRVIAESNYNGVKLAITDGVQTEKLTLIEGDEFSDEFDNKYDAEKIENGNNFSFYCLFEDTKYSAFASNDLTDKTLAFDCKKAGEYTLNVTAAKGEVIKIYDAVANKLIELEANAEYKFNAEAINDAQRFIINPSDAPSAIDDVNGTSVQVTKFVGTDGQIYIRRAGNVYTAQGQEVK